MKIKNVIAEGSEWLETKLMNFKEVGEKIRDGN